MVTNKHNLPQSIVNLVKDKEHVENRYSVTELLGSTREILLLRKYANKIEVDVSDTITALFGSAVHKLLEEADSENAEVKMEYTYNNITIVGVADKITDDAIEDYKTTSVSKVQRSDFSDWRDQGLAYAWLRFKTTGEIKRKLRFYALLKDWSKVRYANSSNYPATPLFTWEYDISDSDYDYIEKKIKNKVAEIKEGKLLECTDEERWYTGTKYAVYAKAGDKRASYITDDEDDAHNYISNKCNGAGWMQVRKGDYLKCQLYCKVSKFCDQCKEEN